MWIKGSRVDAEADALREIERGLWACEEELTAVLRSLRQHSGLERCQRGIQAGIDAAADSQRGLRQCRQVLEGVRQLYDRNEQRIIDDLEQAPRKQLREQPALQDFRTLSKLLGSL